LSIFRDIRAQGMNFGKNPFIDVTE
jgi:hypothetical protein